MKYLCLSLLVLNLFSANAQYMSAKLPNYTSFPKTELQSSSTLDKISSADAKKHPEYGRLPYNAPCVNCVEVPDKRTATSRLFIETENEKHTYSQQSYLPLHYKANESDVWHTIDPLLQPVGNNIYAATNQPVPTKCDMNARSTSLGLNGAEFEFNKGLSVYFFQDGIATTATSPANYNSYTIGSEGLKVTGAWQGIDMVQQFNVGEVKTSYIINAPIDFPFADGYMVIEDHFTLPAGYTFVQEKINGVEADGYYHSNYQLKDAAGKVIAIYEQPVYLDARTWGIRGAYKLLQNGNDYTLQMLVPISWLNNPDNVYPLVIDPIVAGTSKFGDYTLSGGLSANLGFTTENLGSCDYNMTVTVPGKSVLTNAYAELEYRLTYDPFCGNPNLPAPFCTFSQVTMEVVCDSCGTSTGLLACNPASPPHTGTCTTDSVLMPNADPILINSITPNYLACYAAQCADYQIDFTLKNRDSTCQDVCGYLCANGTMWQMTVEAISELETPTISVSGNTLTSSSSTGNQWYLNDTLMPGATAQQYTYTEPGIYSVRQADSLGCQSGYAVVDMRCQAFFTMAYIGLMGDTNMYAGTNLSIGEGLSYLWDFGDGTTSTEATPWHTYPDAGHYNLCLTITRDSCTHTYCDSSFFVFKNADGSINQIQIYEPVVGIGDVDNKGTLQIYPNPATNELNIAIGQVNAEWITVYDVNGKKVIAQAYTPMLNTSAISRGIYYLEVSYGNKVMHKKFVKE